MKYKVFISYHHGKASDLAKKIYISLVAEGISVFRDEESIAPGESISRAIREALDDCEYLICIITADWLSSEWTNSELDTIIMSANNKKKKRIIPLIAEHDIMIPPGIEQYRSLDFSDWESNFVIKMTDLLRALSSSTDFFDKQKERILNSSMLPWLPLNSVSFDYIWPDLFVDTELKCFKHNISSTIQTWLEKSNYDQNTLIMGDPGVGKSTMLKYIIIKYAYDYRIAYFTAKELSETVSDTHSDFLQELLSTVYPYKNFNLNINDLKCIVIDALDEVGPFNIEKIFNICRTLNNMNIIVYISVREDFYFRYIHNNTQRYEIFYEIIQIQEWTIEQGKLFANKVLSFPDGRVVYDRIIKMIESNEYIHPMIKNPFKLSLILFLFSDVIYKPAYDISNVFALYKEFYDHWLLQEKGKKTSFLSLDVIEDWHKQIALELYESHTSISLSSKYTREGITLLDLMRDTGITGLLQINKTNDCVIEKFRHETLAEFLIAKMIVDSFINGGDSVIDTMHIVYNNSVNIFVRSYFDILSYQKLIKITNNLNDIYKDLLNEKYSIPLSMNERIREQLIYYAGRVPVNYIPEMLEYAYNCETNSILKRSAALSLILGGNEKIELEYLGLVLSDDIYNLENRSIQLVYFGDVDGDLHTYKDIYFVPWIRTKKALLDRFSGNTIRDIRLRLWDLITFKSFITDRGLMNITKKDIEIIENCIVDTPYSSKERNKLLKREKEEILQLLIPRGEATSEQDV